MEEYGIFDGLGDLSEDGYNFSSIDEAFLELNDLDTPLEHPIDEASGLEVLSTDASIVSYNCHVNLDHFCHGGTFSGSIQNYSGLSQSLDQSNYPRNHFNVLRKVGICNIPFFFLSLSEVPVYIKTHIPPPKKNQTQNTQRGRSSI